MKTIGELQLLPVWVNPNHRVASAKILLAGHKLRALGVIEGGTLIGTIGFEELSLASDQDEVRRFAKPLSRTINPEDPCRSVADIMAADQLDYLPVVERGQYLGVVTSTMLLGELGRSWDPLTGLSWSDGLRDWGMQKLKDGNDVTILFLDLDDFGLYNKKFGHIVGDRVLMKVAEYLRTMVESETDVLVRYGGDEFAIATLRTRRETEDLLKNIERGLQGTLVAESDEPVSVSAGIFGGRRTKERENVHYSATLDSLINMASRDAMAAKVEKKRIKAEGPAPAAVAAPEPSAPQRISGLEEVSVVEVFSTGDSPSSMDTVILSQKDKVASGVHARGDSTRVQSVVSAAAKALERLAPPLKFEIGDVELSEREAGERYVTVSGRVSVGDESRNVSASCRASADPYRAAAEAVIEAAAA